MFIKIIVFFFAVGLFSLLKYTEPYYFLCKTFVDNKLQIEIPITDNHTYDKEKYESLNYTCHNFFIDYSNHTLMKYTINKIINTLYSSKKYENVEIINELIKSIETNQMKLMLSIIKLILLFGYVAILYFIIVVIPNYLANWTVSILNKILLVFFGLLFFEGIAKSYLSLNIDSIYLFEKYNSKLRNWLPIRYLIQFCGYILDKVFNWFKY